MGQIRLNEMEFYAYHGCYHEEELTGNHFTIDLMLETCTEEASKSDDIGDALNYAEVYELVKQEMNIRSHLLEHVCSRILNRIFMHFPQLEQAEVRVAKLNPPIGGQVKSVSVCLQKSKHIN